MSNDELRTTFERLKREWRVETDHLSSMGRAVLHRAHTEILDFGTVMIPFMLADMREHHEHWFIALCRLTNASPVPREWAGQVPKMAECWWYWGVRHGYVCPATPHEVVRAAEFAQYTWR